MAKKLNPRALAQMDDDDTRPGVQVVTQAMIRKHVISGEELPPESAEPFSAYLNGCWYDWVGDDSTNAEVIAGALAFWRGA